MNMGTQGNSYIGSAQTASSPANTSIMQCSSNIDDLTTRVRRNTVRLSQVLNQIIGPRPEQVRAGQIEGNPTNLMSSIERLREALTEHENMIDSFYNQ